jgi:TolB-like protein/tetratricopeptide (TPR) repeat protein
MKTTRLLPVLLLFSAISMIVLAGGCNTPPDKKYFKDGRQYGVVKGLFRERWWNFYERGCSFSQGGFYPEAIADFKEALRQRDRDQRRARTYGMHVIDYFPHRELGAAYFHTGNYNEAQKQLEDSLLQADSGRAKYYLNEVRTAILKTSGADTPPATIQVTAGGTEAVSNRYNLKVAGVVEDEAYARTVAVNNDPLFVELAQKKLEFSKEVKLKKGLNEIRIKTKDLLGKVAEKTVTVTGDFEGPQVNLHNVADGQEVAQKEIILSGAIADASGIASLKINDQQLAYNKERAVAFSHTVQLHEGNNTITLAAHDVAGNRTNGELNLVCVPKRALRKTMRKAVAQGRAQSREPLRLALAGEGMLDTGGNRFFTAALQEQMDSQFKLTLKELSEKQTVFYATMYIDGSVSGPDDIVAVKIDGSPLSIKPGKNIFFSQLVELKPGDNRISIEVQDKKGATSAKTVTITYQVPAVMKLGSRMSIAVLPFELKGDATPAGSTVYDNLVAAFLNQERFNVVSRGPELEAALRELKLSATDLADKTRALQVGKIIAAEGILMGTVNETRNSIEIYARLINTETTGLMDAKDVYAEDKNLAQVQFIVNGLAWKFKHSFPLVEGIVIKAAGKDVYADFGTASRVKKDMKFIVYREGAAIVHPITGKKLGAETKELGEARIINVLEDMTIGKLIADIKPGEQIQVKDKIVTK